MTYHISQTGCIKVVFLPAVVVLVANVCISVFVRCAARENEEVEHARQTWDRIFEKQTHWNPKVAPNTIL